MVATFTTEARTDLLSIDDRGKKQANTAARRLKEINLYSKADFAKNGYQARNCVEGLILALPESNQVFWALLTVAANSAAANRNR